MEVKELLDKIQPLVRTKAELINVERKIKGYQDIIADLEKEKAEIHNRELDDEVLDQVEAWAESLSDGVVSTSEIRILLGFLEFLNK